MVYADGSNPSVRKDIGVRLPSPAHSSGSRLPGDVGCGSAKRGGPVYGWADFVSSSFKHLRFCRTAPTPPGARFGVCRERSRSPMSFSPTHYGFMRQAVEAEGSQLLVWPS